MTALYTRIEADPPWPENGGGGRGCKYPTLPSPEAIHFHMTRGRFGDNSIVWTPADHCVLLLWVTNNYFPWALKIIGWLGFRHITQFTWCKPSIGTGFWSASSTEHCVLAVKGKPPMPATEHRIPTDFGGQIPRPRHTDGPNKGKVIHSRKPRVCLDMFERAFPAEHALEMFSRTPNRPGVRSWGNETDFTPIGQTNLFERPPTGQKATT